MGGADKPTVGPDPKDELAFMATVLAQLRAGDQQPLSRFTDEDLEALEQERIGEAFSRYPFLY